MRYVLTVHDFVVINSFALGVCGVAIPNFAAGANTSIFVGPTATPGTPSPRINGSSGGTVPFTGGASSRRGTIHVLDTAVVGALFGVLLWAL